MWRVKVFIRAALGFSRTETNGLLLLVPLSLIILASEPFYRNFLETHKVAINWKVRDSVMNYIRAKRNTSVPKDTIDLQAADLQHLIYSGLRRQIALRLVHFRDAGGMITNRKDLLKIYDMDSAWAMNSNFIFPRTTDNARRAPLAIKQKSKLYLDLNLVDSLQLLMIKGVGPVRARRILLFREKLGGFVNIDQLKEVYGIDSITLKELRKSFFVRQGFNPRKISLNRSSWEEFAAHPYLTRKEAATLLAYRTQHGKFDSLHQVLEVRLLEKDRIVKLLPYLSLD